LEFFSTRLSLRGLSPWDLVIGKCLPLAEIMWAASFGLQKSLIERPDTENSGGARQIWYAGATRKMAKTFNEWRDFARLF